MPIPLSTICQARLFGIAAALGELRNEAYRHGQLPKEIIAGMGVDVLSLSQDCDAVVLNQCVAEAQELLLALGTAHEAPEGNQAENIDRVGYITPSTIGLLQCIMDNAQLIVEHSDEGPFTDWPEGNQGWIQWLEPNRQTVR